MQYKCPVCAAPLNYSAEVGKLRCEHCGTATSVEDLASPLPPRDPQLKETETSASEPRDDHNTIPSPPETPVFSDSPATYLDETTGVELAQFQCNSCGGEIIGNPDLVSSKCPWCNNNFVAVGQLTSTRVPDRMIPFAVTKEQAIEIYRNYAKNLPLAPKYFTRDAIVQEIKGVYVPYWLYDAHVQVKGSFEAKSSTSHQVGDYIEIRTNIYQLDRAGQLGFADVPVTGSSRISTAMTEAVEPFDYSQTVPFNPAYLSGFMTDKYDIEADTAHPRAWERIRESANQYLIDSTGKYDAVTPTGTQIEIARGQLEYAFLPIWVLNIHWGGRLWPFAINGQTGRFSGTFPVSKSKTRQIFWGVGLGLSAVLLASLVAVWFLA